MIIIDYKGQSMMELVVGVGMLAVVVGAIGILTLSSMRNTQFSKNQAQATKYAQENLEKVRTIKNSNFGVCLSEEVESGTCSTWEEIWTKEFGSFAATCAIGCTFEVKDGCTVTGDELKPLCLSYKEDKTPVGENFLYQIIIEDEDDLEKRITSNVFWKDISGEHSSELVTVMGRR